MDPRTLPTHPFTGLTAIGFTSRGPVWPVVGGSQPVGGGDDEGDDPDDDLEDEEGDGEEGDADALDGDEPAIDWKAMYDQQAAALEATNAKLARARAQAKNLRLAASNSNGNTPTPAAPAAPAPSPRRQQSRQPVAPEPVVVQDTAEIERWQTRAVLSDARAQLLARGCDPELIDAPLSRLKVDQINWDGDEPDLDEYLDEMEERYPKLFMRLFEQPPVMQQTRQPRRAPSIDQGAGSGGMGRAPQESKSFGQMLWESGQGAIGAPRRGR